LATAVPARITVLTEARLRSIQLGNPRGQARPLGTGADGAEPDRGWRRREDRSARLGRREGALRGPLVAARRPSDRIPAGARSCWRPARAAGGGQHGCSSAASAGSPRSANGQIELTRACRLKRQKASLRIAPATAIAGVN